MSFDLLFPIFKNKEVLNELCSLIKVPQYWHTTDKVTNTYYSFSNDQQQQSFFVDVVWHKPVNK